MHVIIGIIICVVLCVSVKNGISYIAGLVQDGIEYIRYDVFGPKKNKKVKNKSTQVSISSDKMMKIR